MTTEKMPESSARPGEIHGIDGDLPEGKVVIVASRYNAAICDALVDGAKQTILDAGYPEHLIPIVRVPGAWELPTVVRTTIDDEEVVGVIALGCVIKGETTHDEHINRAVSTSLMDLAMESGIPIGFGVLTCNTQAQAEARAAQPDQKEGAVGNKGIEAANAVLELLRLNQKLASEV
ncbi:6,7-dimethyl-8-ribityllumazine synthase [Rubripirellula lacrimiformis]|uniref:6,7-dimethyl-8-ribityllumazine synthase n=1 Tax=Rubripirellula lacrimiformis TaxID=1930273 RepID=A0A517NDR2_9BACT|nr:6,7-dimethyl-8-ribityllumazine synthase [Rubripirellula lacrimiformis]QDT05266.1 6,7-dimethyl-8-ribityllumazine synthase [Rubripirellula lacrimiformis]